MILTIIFFCTIIICFIKPKYGVYSIFVFAILLSNALQLSFVMYNRGFSTPFSYIGLSGLEIIDKQGVRVLIVILFIVTLLKKVYEKERIHEIRLLLIVFVILLFSFISILLNDISLRSGFSSISLFIISLLFLAAVSNIQFTTKDIQIFLSSMLLFVSINSAFEIYQYLFFARGDVDMTVGLLMSTTPTSTFAFVVSFFFIAKLCVGKHDKSVTLSIFISITQLVASYLKGIAAFVIIILTSFRKLLFSGGKLFIASLFALIIMFSISAYIFQDAVKETDVILKFENISMFSNVGPVRVWTQYFNVLDNPVNLIFGFGPSSYGSLNATDKRGNRTSKLRELMIISGAGKLAGRDMFGTALSSAGNILWENGVIVLVLFFLTYYYLFKISSWIYIESKNEMLKIYAFGVKYEIVFIVLLYFTAFAVTTEEILLWGPAFVVFSYLKSEFQLELNKE
jgi:hypothetical protein